VPFNIEKLLFLFGAAKTPVVEKEIKVLEDGMRVNFSIIRLLDGEALGNGFSHVSHNTRVVYIGCLLPV